MAHMAHDGDVLHGSRTLAGMTEADRATLLRLEAAIVGRAWSTVDIWAQVDPEEIGGDGVSDMEGAAGRRRCARDGQRLSRLRHGGSISAGWRTTHRCRRLR